MSTPNRKRNLLDFKQKCEIIDYAMKHPKAFSHRLLLYFFLVKLPVKRRTVGDILSNKETYESV